MFGLLLLLAPVAAQARLRGVQAAEPLPTVSCGKGAAAEQRVAEEPAADDGFDEMALFQQEVEPVEGMHKKTPEEWLDHWNDHKTKISAEQRVLHNETVASQLAKIDAGICEDDPMWRDSDGDGCDIYKFAISSGKMTQDIACGGGGTSPAPGLRGASVKVAADATAKVFCPVTCGMCKKPESQDIAIDEVAVETMDDVTFLQVGVSSSKGAAKRTTEEFQDRWEHNFQSGTRISADQRVLDNQTVAFQLHKLEEDSAGRGCADDPLWRDADGDGCEIYKFAIDSGKTSRDVVCNGGGEQDSASPRLRGRRELVVADATARVFCPVTCGVC